MNAKTGFLSALAGLLVMPAAGALDSSFNADGVRRVSPAGIADNALGRALALIPEGGFYVAGTAANRDDATQTAYLIRRFASDGSDIATSVFGVDLQHVGSLSVGPRSLLAIPTGGVVASIGLANANSPEDSYTRIVRYTSSGAPAPGVADFEFDNSTRFDSLGVLAMQLDGKVLAAGTSGEAFASGGAAVLTRINTDGTLDTAFGSDGYVKVNPGIASQVFAQRSYDEISFNSINLMEDGRILVAGTALNFVASQSEMLFLRLLPNGQPDPTFNNGAPLLYAVRSGGAAAPINTVGGADVSPEGSFLIGGRTVINGNGQGCLLLFNPLGELIASQLDDLGSFDTFSDVQLLPNGGAVAVGTFLDGSFQTRALMAINLAGIASSGDLFEPFGNEPQTQALSAVAFDPDARRLVSVGHGVTQEQGLFAFRWVLYSTPIGGDLDVISDPFNFAEQLDVQTGDDIQSELVQITGLDEGVRVPVRVYNGEATVGGRDVLNNTPEPPFYGALTYATAPFGQPTLLDAVTRHVAAATAGTERKTRLVVGGVVRSNNLAATVGLTGFGLLKSVTAADVAGPGEIRFTTREDQQVEGTRATLGVRRYDGSSGAIELGFSILDVAAGSGLSGTLSWADGETAEKFIGLDTVDDNVFQGTRVYEVYLDGASGGATVDSNPQGTITILDNDSAPTPTPTPTAAPTAVPTAVPTAMPTAPPTTTPTATPAPTPTASPSAIPTATPAPTPDPRPGSVRISELDSSVREGQTARFTVRRVGGSNGAVSVRYSVSPGTAVPVSDYENGSGTLSWADGQDDVRTVSIRTLDNSAVDGARTFRLVLSDATGGLTLGTPSTATTTITDNDFAPEPVGSVDLTLTNGDVINISTSTGSLANARTVPTPSGLPAGFDFPMEFFSFDITDLPAAGTAQITLTLPTDFTPDAFVNCTAALCAVLDSAVIDDNVITLTLVDGGPGDADGTANGTIVSPGAPAQASGGNGGGAFGLLSLLTLSLLAGVTGLRRQAGNAEET